MSCDNKKRKKDLIFFIIFWKLSIIYQIRWLCKVNYIFDILFNFNPLPIVLDILYCSYVFCCATKLNNQTAISQTLNIFSDHKRIKLRYCIQLYLYDTYRIHANHSNATLSIRGSKSVKWNNVQIEGVW